MYFLVNFRLTDPNFMLFLGWRGGGGGEALEQFGPILLRPFKTCKMPGK